MFEELEKKKNHGRCKICGRAMDTSLHPIGPVCLKKIRKKLKNPPINKNSSQKETMFDLEDSHEKTGTI